MRRRLAPAVEGLPRILPPCDLALPAIEDIFAPAPVEEEEEAPVDFFALLPDVVPEEPEPPDAVDGLPPFVPLPPAPIEPAGPA